MNTDIPILVRSGIIKVNENSNSVSIDLKLPSNIANGNVLAGTIRSIFNNCPIGEIIIKLIKTDDCSVYSKTITNFHGEYVLYNIPIGEYELVMLDETENVRCYYYVDIGSRLINIYNFSIY